MKSYFITLCVVAISACFWSINAAASDQGKALYSGCVACHGAQGEGNPALKAPALAGQSQSYLQRQLEHFQSGLRGSADGDLMGAQMRSMAALLKSPAEIEYVSAYIATLPVTVASDSSAGDARRGQNLYQGNCGACHGGKAEGNAVLNAPRLAGLDSAYIKQQLSLYQQGARGSDKSDRLGRQMAMMAGTLPDAKAIDDVIAYIQQVNQ